MKPVLIEAWSRMRDRLRVEYGEATFESWLKALTLAEQRGKTVRLAAPTLIVRDFIDQNFGRRIADEWRAADQGVEAVEIIVKPNGQRPSAAIKQEAAAPEQPAAVEAAQSPLDEQYSFDSFVSGAANELALRAAQKVAESLRPPFNPLYMFGATGLGKTHLLQAIGLRARALNPRRKIAYLTAERFLNLFVRALNERQMIEFKEQYRSLDLLLIDDLQFVGRMAAAQEEFLHTLNALTEAGRQVVVAADRPPVDLDVFGPSLRSRLAGGMLVEIQPADVRLRLAILKARADALGIECDPLALEFIAERMDTNVRELLGALTSIAPYYEHARVPVTLDIAEAALRNRLRVSEKKIGIEDIQKRVAEHYKVRVAELRSARRSLSIVRPRQIAMYLCKHLTTRSLPEIGRMFGDKDHTTVLHAIRRIDELSQKDNALRDNVELLRRLLSQ